MYLFDYVNNPGSIEKCVMCKSCIYDYVNEPGRYLKMCIVQGHALFLH